MKLHLPVILRCVLLSACLMSAADAAVRHTDVSLNTYVDFANNNGRYVTGVTNAMLDYIRQRDGGVRISYTGGQADYTLEHGMVDFDSVSDMGNMTVVGYNYAVTVAHNSSQMAPTFTRNDYGIGAENSQKYLAAEEYEVDSAGKPGYTFVHHIYSATNDYKLSRLTKLVTDATPAQMAGGANSDYKGELVYRVGGGQQWLRDGNEKSDESSKDVYLVGGIAGITDWSSSGSDIRHATVVGTTSWDKGAGVGDGTPLPFGSTEGDSGSPYFVWDGNTYKFLSTHHGSTNDNKQTLSCEARDWTQSVIDADSVRVDMGRVSGSLVINGAEERDDKGGISGVFNGTTVNVVAARGFLSDANGILIDEKWNSVAFNGVATGQHTWKSLSALKDTNNWYAYGNEYLNATESVVIVDKEAQAATGVTYAKLFLTQNLVFEAAEDDATYGISVTEDTDLGAGYLHFAANGHKNVQYNVTSEKDNLLNSAGYVVDAGVTVNVSLRNTDALYMREWRKVGEGELKICGDGENEIFLNVGGTGRTVLAQINGYAAYNVVVNTGSTVVISDTEQIARDLTFGNGGGTLDMNGNSMDWYTSGGQTRDGFTIQALTEEALVANYNGKSVLSFKEGGNQTFVGSFADSAKSSLKVDYQGGGTLTLNSIRTTLNNADSGLTVSNGTVKLAGTLTVHGYGTVHTNYGENDTADFSTRDNDWHYADAAMNVTVKDKATFELESHARLTGTVTVESGGKYVMREGVQHAEEYVEGGERTEKTAELAAYFGHKGDVKLSAGAEMQVVFSAETDADMSYSGSVSGPGALKISLGTDKAAFHMKGSIDGVKTLELLNSSKVYLYGAVNVGSLQVEAGSELILEEGADISVLLTSLVTNGESLVTQEMTLQQYGGDDSLVILKDSRVLEVLSAMLNGVSLQEGGALSLNLAELGDVSEYDYIRLSFSGLARSTNIASLSEKAQVTAILANGQELTGYYVQGETGTAYFAVVPEPATGTLSLLSLSLLCSRRRRR